MHRNEILLKPIFLTYLKIEEGSTEQFINQGLNMSNITSNNTKWRVFHSFSKI